MVLKLGLASILGMLLLAPAMAGETNPALVEMMDKSTGTISVFSQPMMSEGKLVACQLVFDSFVRDWTYRQGDFLKVSGSIGFMKADYQGIPTLGATLKVIVNEIDLTTDLPTFTPSAPTRAYLAGPDYSTNLESLTAADPGEDPGSLFSVFQSMPSLELVVDAMQSNEITVAFNSRDGKSDLQTKIEIDVTDVDQNGKRTRSPQTGVDFMGCMTSLTQDLR